MNYTMKLFNTGQVTLPKKWRDKYPTKHFIAKEVSNGLLIQPIEPDVVKDDVVYYESKDGFGIYSEKGFDGPELLQKILKIHGQD